MEVITNCNTCPTCQHKKPGRKPKYASEEERIHAKREQTRKCVNDYYEKNKGLINEKIKKYRKEQTLQRKQEKLSNKLLETFQNSKINNKMELIQKMLKSLHV